MATSPHDIARILLQAQAVLLRPNDPFTFVSGLRSPIYCDNRLLIGNVAARRVITAAFAAQSGDAQVIAGTATAGIPWAAWVAEALDMPMAYVRGSAKGHGRGRQIEGASVAGRRVILLEDTISTGESSLQAAGALRSEGADVLGCLCIFTWGWEATRAAFAEARMPLAPLAQLSALLDVAVAEGFIGAEQRALIERWAVDPKGWESGNS